MLKVEEGKLAALICLTQGDVDHVADLAFQLDEDLGVTPPPQNFEAADYPDQHLATGTQTLQFYSLAEQTNRIKALMPCFVTSSI